MRLRALREGELDFSLRRAAVVRPTQVLALRLGLLRIAGIPPFGGFFGKLFLLFSSVNLNNVFSLIFIVVSSIIIVYIYVRIFYSTASAGTPVQALLNKGRTRLIASFLLLSGPLVLLVLRVGVIILRFGLRENN